MPSLLTVLQEWQSPGWNAELLLYTSGYMGNITPAAWRSASNFLLHVADGGEQAEVLAMGVLPKQKQRTLSALFAELHHATPDEIRSLGSVATVGRENKPLFVATALADNRLAIGGVLLHTNQTQLNQLQGMFQEGPLQLPGEA